MEREPDQPLRMSKPPASAVSADPGWTREAVADANRRYYALTASDYEAHESCVVEAEPQRRLQDDLAALAQRIQPAGRRPRALDACGGTGNATLKLLEAGFDVVSVDISEEMQAILREKLAGASWAGRCRLENSAIGPFLGRCEERFDLIVFSSALHHMVDYAEVLEACRECLATGGWLYTNFDPTRRAALPLPVRTALRLDYWLYKIFVRSDELPASARRWIRRRLHGGPTPDAVEEASLGVLAEFHARDGIDDFALVDRLAGAGFRVERHARRANARLRPFESWLWKRGAATEFSLWLRRAGDALAGPAKPDSD